MDMTTITPDYLIWWQWGMIKLNATIVFTLAIMGLLTLGACC